MTIQFFSFFILNLNFILLTKESCLKKDSLGILFFYEILLTNWDLICVIGVECIFTWYWIADFCAENGIDFALGHALYMKAIHGGKTKSDKIDSEKIANILRGASF